MKTTPHSIDDHETGQAAACLRLVALAAALCCSGLAFGAEIATGSDVKLRVDNTFKYSAAWRVKDPSDTLVSPLANPQNPNLDDGDRNFKRGLISNRVDWLGEADLSWKNLGARLSAAAWYDSVYNRATDFDFPPTFNPFSVAPGNFTDATRDLHGRKAEVLDAFVFGRWNLDGRDTTLRLGKHAFLWGESLFFGTNGIAAGQAPFDVIKALSVPNTQFKELLRPVNQVSGQIALTPRLSMGGYYQFEWERNRLPASGSYFSFADFLDAGGERLFVGPGQAFHRTGDLNGRDSGQFGLQARWRMEKPDVDFGAYAIQYNDKSPQIYLYPGAVANPANPAGPPIILNPALLNPAIGKFGEYALVFPEKIRAYGASFSTTLFDANVAGEASLRTNAPLVSGPVPVLAPGADNGDNALYAMGKTAHAQLSVIHSMPATPLWGSANLIGEIAWNRRLSIARNATMLDPNTTRDATALRFVFEPAYYQVVDGLDLTIPIGVGYTEGRSSAVQGFGVHQGGDVSIGVSGTYLAAWKFSLNYTHYYGPEGSFLTPTGALSFKQDLRDRDFVSLSVSRTF